MFNPLKSEMSMKNKLKIELYFMSLSVLFFFLILKTLDIPIYIGPDMQFVGWKYLLCENIIAIIFGNYIGVSTEKWSNSFFFIHF